MNARVFRFLGAGAMLAVVLTASAQANAPAGRYAIAGGTVTDTRTKLTWQQMAPSATYTLAAAKTYCPTLGASLGGTGWRLPTIKELLTIVDDSQRNPSIDPTAFPATPSAAFWSSSPPGAPGAWDVIFTSGFTTQLAATSTINVRCVR